MLEFIKKKIRAAIIQGNTSPEETQEIAPNPSGLKKSLKESLNEAKQIFGKSGDIIIREFSFGNEPKIQAALIFVDGLISNEIINSNIIEPLMFNYRMLCTEEKLDPKDISSIMGTIISVGDVKKISGINDLTSACMSGDTVLMIDGFTEAIQISTKGYEKRSVTDPQTESVIRGPREAFTENLRTNTSLLRRKIRNPDLIIESRILGEKTKTPVCIAYIKGIANDDLIKEVTSRLGAINQDSVLESGYIEEYIEDAPLSPFPTVGYTEKPDVAAAKLLEGRIAIISDGTPFVLTVPYLFIEGFQAAEDYYSRPYYTSFLRIIRLLSFLVTLLAPAVYVALTTFHQELIPTPLLFAMAAAREGVPFAAVIEAGLMIFAFEILREAGVRLPRPVGQAMSIVGALVVGQAAVSAGIIGAPMVIIVAITAVSSFVVPTQAESVAVLRIVLLILGGSMGGFGITFGMLWILIHLSSLKSFGFPYLTPLAPMETSGMKDSFVRFPLWTMLKRPAGMAIKDETRRKYAVPPVGVLSEDDVIGKEQEKNGQEPSHTKP